MFYFLLFYNALDLNNQKILWLPSTYQFERKMGFWTTLISLSSAEIGSLTAEHKQSIALCSVISNNSKTLLVVNHPISITYFHLFKKFCLISEMMFRNYGNSPGTRFWVENNQLNIGATFSALKLKS